MNPEAIDTLIMHSLHARGRQNLRELAADTSVDAREILKRLHVLVGQKQVLAGRIDKAIAYWLAGEYHTTTSEETRHETGVEEDNDPPCIPLRSSAPESAAVPAPAEAAPTQVAPVLEPKAPPRRKSTTIVIRPEVKATRLALTTMPHGCIIDDGDLVVQESVGETCGVFIPTADIPGLIAALQQVIA